MGRFFVTGATGFVGGRLARLLSAQSHDVVCIARSVTAPAALLLAQLPRVAVVAGDVTDKESMRAALTEQLSGGRVDGVFHAAAWYKVGVNNASRLAHETNVVGTRNVVELVEELRIPKCVYVSSLAVNSDTKGVEVDETYKYTGTTFSSVYEESKHRAHYDVVVPAIERGVPIVICSPGPIIGPGDTSSMHDVLSDFVRGMLPVLPKAFMMSPAHVDDVAKALTLAMERGRVGETYFVCGDSTTMAQLGTLLSVITRRRAPIGAPRGLFEAAALVSWAIGKVVPLPSKYSYETLHSSAGSTFIGSNLKARRELGYDPRPLRDALVDALWWEYATQRKTPPPVPDWYDINRFGEPGQLNGSPSAAGTAAGAASSS